MKASASEFEVLVVPSTLHMNPPSLTRPKSSASMTTIVVDMGNRGEADNMLRLKSNGAMDAYSPAKKPSAARPEPVSRIHCIPLLMVFVFFILWTASSEILPEKSYALPKRLVMKLDPSNKLATSEGQTDGEISKHGTRTVLDHDNRNSYAKGDGSHSLEYERQSRKRLSVRSTYMKRDTAS